MRSRAACAPPPNSRARVSDWRTRSPTPVSAWALVLPMRQLEPELELRPRAPAKVVASAGSLLTKEMGIGGVGGGGGRGTGSEPEPGSARSDGDRERSALKLHFDDNVTSASEIGTSTYRYSYLNQLYCPFVVCSIEKQLFLLSHAIALLCSLSQISSPNRHPFILLLLCSLWIGDVLSTIRSRGGGTGGVATFRSKTSQTTIESTHAGLHWSHCSYIFTSSSRLLHTVHPAVFVFSIRCTRTSICLFEWHVRRTRVHVLIFYVFLLFILRGNTVYKFWFCCAVQTQTSRSRRRSRRTRTARATTRRPLRSPQSARLSTRGARRVRVRVLIALVRRRRANALQRERRGRRTRRRCSPFRRPPRPRNRNATSCSTPRLRLTSRRRAFHTRIRSPICLLLMGLEVGSSRKHFQCGFGERSLCCYGHRRSFPRATSVSARAAARVPVHEERDLQHVWERFDSLYRSDRQFIPLALGERQRSAARRVWTAWGAAASSDPNTKRVHASSTHACGGDAPNRLATCSSSRTLSCASCPRFCASRSRRCSSPTCVFISRRLQVLVLSWASGQPASVSQPQPTKSYSAAAATSSPTTSSSLTSPSPLSATSTLRTSGSRYTFGSTWRDRDYQQQLLPGAGQRRVFYIGVARASGRRSDARHVDQRDGWDLHWAGLLGLLNLDGLRFEDPQVASLDAEELSRAAMVAAKRTQGWSINAEAGLRIELCLGCLVSELVFQYIMYIKQYICQKFHL